MNPGLSGKAVTNVNLLRWTAVGLLLVVGALDFYYGNANAGFWENLWYVMGGIYIFAALVVAADIQAHFSQLLVFAYALFLLTLWLTTSLETGAGLSPVAYADKALEAILVINMALLLSSSRPLRTV